MGTLQSNVQKQGQQEQPNGTSDTTNDCSLNVLPIGQSRNNGMNVKQAKPAVAVREQTSRSPPAKKVFTGRPKSASPARRRLPHIPWNRIIGDGSFSHGHVPEKSADNGSIFAGRAWPSTLSFSEPANNIAAIRRESGTSVDDISALTSRPCNSESSSDASLMASGPVFAKRPVVVSDKAVQQKKTFTSRKLPPLKQSVVSLPPTHSSDRKLSPRKHPAANIVKQSAAALPKKNDSKVAALGAQNQLSSGNLFSRPSTGRNKFSASGDSPYNKSVRNKASVKKLAFGAATRFLKKKGQPVPGESDLVALGRKNKGRGSSLLNDRIRKAAATTAMKKSVPSKPNSPGTNPTGTKVPSPALKRASLSSVLGNKSILKDRNGGDDAGSKNITRSESHASQTRHVDRTVSPPAVDAQSASSQPPVPSLNSYDNMTTPFSTKKLPSLRSSSTGSVVSPTEEICDKLVSVTSSNHQDSSESQVPSDPNKNESTIQATTESKSLTSLTETADILPASSNQSDAEDSPMAESQASTDFAETSDSDSELSDEGVVAENAKSLHDSLTFMQDEGINTWKRQMKRVDYKEPGDHIEMDISESFDSPPKKRRKTQTHVSSDQDSANLVRSSKRKRTPANSSSSDSLCRQESLPDLEDEESEELKECLQLIEHSSKYTYDESGLPTHEFSVFSHDGMSLFWVLVM